MIVSAPIAIILRIGAAATLIWLIGLYLYSFYKFHHIVRAKRSEWVAANGSLSFMFDWFPAGDPNAQWATFRLLFSSRVSELDSPLATKYARRVRILLLITPALMLLLIAL